VLKILHRGEEEQIAVLHVAKKFLPKKTNPTLWTLSMKFLLPSHLPNKQIAVHRTLMVLQIQISKKLSVQWRLTSPKKALDDPVSSSDLPICEDSHGCCFETVCEDPITQEFSSVKSLDNPGSVDPVGVPEITGTVYFNVLRRSTKQC